MFVLFPNMYQGQPLFGFHFGGLSCLDSFIDSIYVAVYFKHIHYKSV